MEGSNMKKRISQLAALSLAGVMVVGLAACGSGSKGGGSAAKEGGSSGDTITVGFVYPKTGALAAFGAHSEDWTKYAIDVANKKGIKVDGKDVKLQLVAADSESSATKASEAANNLINSKKVDIMITSKTADTTVPVAAACERAGVVCLSVDTPDEAWATSDYKYAFHAGFNTKNELSAFKDAWDLGDTNKKVAVMHATDTEGQTMINAFSDFAKSNGYTAYDPGAYTSGATDYSSIISNIKSQKCEVVAGVMLTSDYGTFFKQLKSSGYMPKVITVAKATLFKADVDSIGANGLASGLCSEVWWRDDYPYKSSLDGMNCKDLGKKYIEVTGDSYAVPTAGYDYANIEILAAVINKAGSMDKDKLAAAAADLDLDTVIGKIKYNDKHYSVQALTTGQWIYKDGKWTQNIIANSQIPDAKTTADIQLLK
jgi:branched-chain amino acid transport system substrate-binding protein